MFSSHVRRERRKGDCVICEGVDGGGVEGERRKGKEGGGMCGFPEGTTQCLGSGLRT